MFSRSLMIVAVLAVAACATPPMDSVAEAPPPADDLRHHYVQTTNNRVIVQGGAAPENIWSPIVVAEGGEYLYPLDVIQSNWRVESLRLYLAATPRGASVYDLAVTRFDAHFGVTGFLSVAGSEVTATSQVIDFPKAALGVRFAAPLFLRVDAYDSFTAFGVVDIGYVDER